MPSASSTGPAGRSLPARILAGLLAVLVVVLVGTGIAALLLAREQLSDDLDEELVQTAQRFDAVAAPGEPAPPGGSAGTGTTVLRVGLRDGKIVTQANGAPLNHVVDERTHKDTTLDPAQVELLMSARPGPVPKRVDLGKNVGEYVVVADTDAADVVQITGLPTAPVERTVAGLARTLALGTVLGLLAAGLGGYPLLRRNLAALERVAATARAVSGLRLDSGDVALAPRVPDEDTDRPTEVAEVGRALNTLLDHVEEALRARQESERRVRQFVADVSHELRTPLASIRGYAELSRREHEPVPATVVRALERVESEAVRMSALVEDLLLLARLDEGRPLAREEVDLSVLAIDAVGDAHAAGPDHTWLLELPDLPVTVRGDPARLHQVLANLLGNARIHTPAGTTVRTVLRLTADDIELTVADDGPGIPDALQHSVFERFIRGDEARGRDEGSTGLGLSIVEAVVRAHGGRVTLASRAGATAFTVHLPSPP